MPARTLHSPIRGARLRGYGTRPGASAREICRFGLAGEKYSAAQPDARLLLFSRCHSYYSRSRIVARQERVTAAGFVRELPALPRRLPDTSLRRTLRHGCSKVHFLPDDRTARLHPRRVPRANGKSCFRLRHLPGRLSLEPARTDCHHAAVPAQGFSRARRKPRRNISPVARRIALRSETGMAPRAKRSRLSRTLSRKPSQTCQMARPDAQRLHCAWEFRPAAGDGGPRSNQGSARAARCFGGSGHRRICPLGAFAHPIRAQEKLLERQVAVSLARNIMPSAESRFFLAELPSRGH